MIFVYMCAMFTNKSTNCKYVKYVKKYVNMSNNLLNIVNMWLSVVVFDLNKFIVLNLLDSIRLFSFFTRQSTPVYWLKECQVP